MNDETSVQTCLDWFSSKGARHIDEVKLEFALQLDIAARSRGIKRKDIAAQVGMSRAWITKVLRGDANPTLDTLQTLAEAVECNVHIHLVPREANSLVPSQSTA